MALTWSAPGWAQSGTASVGGRVTDPLGSAVPGATVTVVRLATAVSRSMATNESGSYEFVGLSPDAYELTVALTGFRLTRIENLLLRTDTRARQDVELAVGSLAETLTVTAETPLLNTTDASIGNTLDERAISSLPVEALNVVELLSLQPGAVFVPFSQEINEGGGVDPRYGAVSGARADQQTVTLDGVDVNDPELQTAYASAVRVTQEALQEFRVSTSNYGAEYGRSSGPQVSMVTRSGTNRFRGSAYWFGRRTGTSSNEYFLKLAQAEDGTNEAPTLDKDIFGASLGGPIVKDRVFFYVNYEQLTEQSERPVTRDVPSGSFRDGVLMYQCENLAQCPGGSVNGLGGTHAVPPGWYGLTPTELAALDPLGIGPNVALSEYLNQYPLPNEPGNDDANLMGYRFAAPIENTFRTYIARLDAKLTASHNVFLRFGAQADDISDPPQFPDQPPSFRTRDRNYGLAVGSDWVLSNTLVNTFRYGLTRIDRGSFGQMTTNATWLRGLSSYDPTTFTGTRGTTTHNFVEQISWLKGDHTLKAGVNLRFTRIPSQRTWSSYLFAGANGFWTAGAGRNYMPGSPQCTGPACDDTPAVAPGWSGAYAIAWGDILGVLSESYTNANYDRDGTLLPVGAPVDREYATEEYELFVQDSWRVHPSLTLTAGLRYSLYSPPHEVNGLQTAPTPSMGGWFAERERNMQAGVPSSASPLVTFDLAGPANDRKGFYDWDKDNLGLHLAVAWTPRAEGGLLGRLTGNDQMVIRAGYSKVFDRVGLGLARQFDRGSTSGLSATAQSPSYVPYDEIPGARWVDPTTMPTIMPEAPPGGFPQTPPVGAGVITGSIDGNLATPSSHVVNFAIGRQVGNDFSVEAAYVGRFGRDQVVRRDLAMPLNLTDPESGMDYFTAAQQMIGAAQQAGLDAGSPSSGFAALAPIPYWENLFPDMAGGGLTATQAMSQWYMGFAPDWITALYVVDQFCYPACSVHGPLAYFAEQYDSLGSISSIGRSNYNALQLTLRKRYSRGLQFDLNYTFSRSKDMGSQAERGGVYGNFWTGGVGGFLVNSWDPDANYGVSDYDVTHQANLSWIWDLPLGPGRRFGGDASGVLGQLSGDWSVAGLVRWTSGFPFNVLNCAGCWPTNWNVPGNAMLVEPGVRPPTETTLNAVDGRPSPFPDPEGAEDYFRLARPGEVGERNALRGDGFFTIDLSLSKAFRLGSGSHRLRIRADVFNLTNTPTFDVFAVSMTPELSDFGRYNRTFATCDGRAGRCMQFAVRYEF